MPYKKRIADVDRGIEELRATLAALRRARTKNPAEIDRLLAEMARLRAQRTRFMFRKRLFEKSRPTHR